MSTPRGGPEKPYIAVSCLHTLGKVPSGGSLADALADALSGKPFNDVLLYASARDEYGAQPRGIYANSRILVSASKYFQELLFQEQESGDDPAPRLFIARTATLADGALYDRDSTFTDGDTIDAFESALPTPNEISFESDEMMELPNSAEEDIKSAATAVSTASGTRVVALDNVAADTLEAVIFYIYTGNVHFHPLRSQDSVLFENAKSIDPSGHSNHPSCCCKAVYCFADEAGLNELKDLADAHLFAQLDDNNIIEEVFSPFSAQYTDILHRQVALLRENHGNHAGLEPVVEKIVRSAMPHAAPALNLLLSQISASKRESITSVEGRPHASEKLQSKPALAASPLFFEHSLASPSPITPPPARTRQAAEALPAKAEPAPPERVRERLPPIRQPTLPPSSPVTVGAKGTVGASASRQDPALSTDDIETHSAEAQEHDPTAQASPQHMPSAAGSFTGVAAGPNDPPAAAWLGTGPRAEETDANGAAPPAAQGETVAVQPPSVHSEPSAAAAEAFEEAARLPALEDCAQERAPVAQSVFVDADAHEPAIAVGGTLHAPQLTLSPPE